MKVNSRNGDYEVFLVAVVDKSKSKDRIFALYGGVAILLSGCKCQVAHLARGLGAIFG
jgi:hypothetical protein